MNKALQELIAMLNAIQNPREIMLTASTRTYKDEGYKAVVQYREATGRMLGGKTAPHVFTTATLALQWAHECAECVAWNMNAAGNGACHYVVRT